MHLPNGGVFSVERVSGTVLGARDTAVKRKISLPLYYSLRNSKARDEHVKGTKERARHGNSAVKEEIPWKAVCGFE